MCSIMGYSSKSIKKEVFLKGFERTHTEDQMICVS